jgi:hypothetical protein
LLFRGKPLYTTVDIDIISNASAAFEEKIKMAYFLGRDVKVAITTEDASNGIQQADATPILTAATDASASSGNKIENRTNAVFDGGSQYNPFTDVTSVDITLGSVDEDIAYMGQRTALKAEIKKETSIVITKKKTNSFFDTLFSDGRYGINGTTLMGPANMTQPTVEFGFRLYVQLQSTNEFIVVPNCVFAEKGTSLSADGVQEETLTFTSHVDPLFDNSTPAGATEGDLLGVTPTGNL